MDDSLKGYYDNYESRLCTVYEPDEARSIAQLVFAETLLVRPHHIRMLDKTLTSSEIARMENMMVRLLTHEPVQYVLGSTIFCGIPIKVNIHVLIPRPETEELVGKILAEQTKLPSPSILDIGTGSGCIAIALKKKWPAAKVTALDASAGALEVASENAVNNRTDVRFTKCDILNPGDRLSGETFDIIVSNPPYITEEEKQAMHPNVLGHEPHSALFVSDGDPLQFYRAIISICHAHLRNGGILFLEINQAFGNQTAGLLRSAGFEDVELMQDLAGNDRMIRARLAGM